MRTLLEEHRDHEVDLVDGIKVFVDDGFVLVRPDPDEPACHIVASVGDEARGHALLDDYRRRVREARGDAGSPADTSLVGEPASRVAPANAWPVAPPD
jgi:mannose-1-phosphate guanylyltransferase/phosphomannomutase